MNLQNWVAWMPGRETASAWRQWAHDGEAVPSSTVASDVVPPPLKEIPPLLRRRADAMGRAALHVLSRPELPYQGQSVVLCSRLGEFRRSLELQRDLACEGAVSPQQFSVSVHNAMGGLFMMVQKAQAPLTALAAGEVGALAGLQEAFIQLADGAQAVWLVYCEEPLPHEYRSLAATPDEHSSYFAFLLELVPGDEFRLASECETAGTATCGDGDRGDVASPMDLLAFFLRPDDEALTLSARGNWKLRRMKRSGNG